MKKLLFLLLLVGTTLSIFAGNTDPEANRVIKGRVTDEKGEPLAGVEVVVEGIGKKVYTDFEGNFEINELKEGAYTLVFNYVAYKEAKDVLKTVLSSEDGHSVKLKRRRPF